MPVIPQNIHYKKKIYQIWLFSHTLTYTQCVKICFVHIDVTIFNQGNLLNWLDHG